MGYQPGLSLKTRLVLLGFFMVVLTGVLSAQGSSFVYVASQTPDAMKGIYAYRFSPKTGRLTSIGRVAELFDASFLATDPHHRVLYVASESGEAPGSNGFLSSYAIDPRSGALKLLNKAEMGGGPCHLSVDKTGKILFVANYGNGTAASFALNPDGSIGKQTGFDQHTGKGPNPERQEGPHAHAAVLSPDNRFLFVPDLGLDQIKIYRVDTAKASFSPNNPSLASVKPGLGPRHLVFAPGGKFAYVICEIGSSVVAFAYDPVKGSLTAVQTISTLPADFKGIDNSAEIDVSPSGRFLYASNRGHDSITVFAIDPTQGTLTKIRAVPTQGQIPRNFALDPTGKYLVAANQKSNQMVVFAVDQTTGLPQPTGQVLDIEGPVCVLFVPAE
jgi:6-phosphogluconolactonase